MTKEELIKEAWGGVFNPHICENGWFNMWYLQHVPNMEKFLDKTEYDIINKCVRPKSLRGIEHNNGWIKIEEGLPKEQGKYLTYRKNGIMTEEHFYLVTPYAWEKFYGVTHWKPIDKQKPPIY
ncbi:hypothetical protein [Empedobacter sp.]|uniref:hypothetical protein n=1 Tax=Empedobacter sp. TaxID=1927715 RepID=UPI00289D099C|nr:hypothetical protein [Empedobacter sp.]